MGFRKMKTDAVPLRDIHGLTEISFHLIAVVIEQDDGVRCDIYKYKKDPSGDYPLASCKAEFEARKRLCEICSEEIPVGSMFVGTGTGVAHRECYYPEEKKEEESDPTQIQEG